MTDSEAEKTPLLVTLFVGEQHPQQKGELTETMTPEKCARIIPLVNDVSAFSLLGTRSVWEAVENEKRLTKLGQIFITNIQDIAFQKKMIQMYMQQVAIMERSLNQHKPQILKPGDAGFNATAEGIKRWKRPKS